MSDDEEGLSVKVTLLGNSGVGKTCIIKRYTDNEFDPQTVPTPGASYSQKIVIINNKPITLDVWDTAGQEQYRSLGRHFYKDSFIVCLVYDITNRESFEDLKTWYNDLKEYGEKNVITAVVGNKSDCYEEEVIKEEEGRKYAEEINSKYFLVSAKEGDNIELLFNTLAQDFMGPEFTEKMRETKHEKGLEKEKKIKVKKEEIKKKKKKKCC
jgi:small GTP-binding protein